MKLKEYIKKEIKKGKTKFNISLNHKGEVDKKGLNKVKFSITK